MVMLFIGLCGALLVWRRTVESHRWFLRLCFAAGPTGFIAVLTGWFTAEVGRQPYTVYGLLRTVDSVSPVTAAAVKTSLIVFVFAYAIVFAAGTYYIFQLAFKGPEETGPPGDSAPEQAILGVPMSMGRDSPAEA
jgi:cytochrome d ubiquinol oxidase subunit I